jgi:hypothetical protein
MSHGALAGDIRASKSAPRAWRRESPGTCSWQTRPNTDERLQAHNEDEMEADEVFRAGPDRR